MSNPEGDPNVRFARNVLVTVATSCQVLTAAAHADAYGHYPVSLLQALSFDLRRSLAGAETVIQRLDEP